MMNNPISKISLTYSQVLELVRQLPKRDKERLSFELAKETSDKRLSRLLSAFKSDKIKESDIIQEVEKARAEIYAKKQKN